MMFKIVEQVLLLRILKFGNTLKSFVNIIFADHSNILQQLRKGCPLSAPFSKYSNDTLRCPSSLR